MVKTIPVCGNVLHGLIRSQPLGAWVTQVDGTLLVNHVPFLLDAARLLEQVTRLSDTQESGHAFPWRVSDAPPQYINNLLEAIVGVEIPISAIVGKWKTQQERSLPNKPGVVAGLYEHGDHEVREMAALVERHLAAEVTQQGRPRDNQAPRPSSRGGD